MAIRTSTVYSPNRVANATNLGSSVPNLGSRAATTPTVASYPKVSAPTVRPLNVSPPTPSPAQLTQPPSPAQLTQPPRLYADNPLPQPGIVGEQPPQMSVLSTLYKTLQNAYNPVKPLPGEQPLPPSVVAPSNTVAPASLDITLPNIDGGLPREHPQKQTVFRPFLNYIPPKPDFGFQRPVFATHPSPNFGLTPPIWYGPHPPKPSTKHDWGSSRGAKGFLGKAAAIWDNPMEAYEDTIKLMSAASNNVLGLMAGYTPSTTGTTTGTGTGTTTSPTPTYEDYSNSFTIDQNTGQIYVWDPMTQTWVPWSGSTTSSGGGSATPTSTTTSSSDVYYNPSTGSITVDGTTYTADQIAAWVSTTPPDQVAATLTAMGVDPYYVMSAYNVATGANITTDQASEYLGIPVTAPAPTPTPTPTTTTGGSPAPTPTPTPTTTTVDIPTTTYPYSTSNNTSLSWSGINWSVPVAYNALKALTHFVPYSLPKTLQYGKEIDEYAHQAMGNMQTVAKDIQALMPTVEQQIQTAQQYPEEYQQTVQALYEPALAEAQTTSGQIQQVSQEAYDQALSMVNTVWQQALQLPDLAAQYGDALYDAVAYMFQKALTDPSYLQATLNQLAAAGMSNSSIAQDIVGKLVGEALNELSNKAYEAQSAGLQARMAVPGQMSAISAQLGGMANQASNMYASNLALANQIYQQALAQALGAEASVANAQAQANQAVADLSQAYSGTGTAASNIYDEAAKLGIGAATSGQEAYRQMLLTLGTLAQLGNQTFSTGTGSSYSADPLAPYKTMIDTMYLLS